MQDRAGSFKKTSEEVEVDQTSTSASKPGTSKQTENLDPTPLRPPLRTPPFSHTDEAMEVDLNGPPLPPHLGDDHSMHDSDPRHVSDQHSGQSEMPRTQEIALLAFLIVQVSVSLGGRRLPPQKGTSKDAQGFAPYQNKPFLGPHNKKRGS